MLTTITLDDLTRAYRKQHPDGLSEEQFDKYLKALTERAAEDIIKGKNVQIITKFGYICVRSRDKERMVNGKECKRINFGETYKLWKTSKEDFLNRTKIYWNSKFVNSLRWIKGSMNLKNKRLYQFYAAKGLKAEVSALSLNNKQFQLR